MRNTILGVHPSTCRQTPQFLDHIEDKGTPLGCISGLRDSRKGVRRPRAAIKRIIVTAVHYDTYCKYHDDACDVALVENPRIRQNDSAVVIHITPCIRIAYES